LAAIEPQSTFAWIGLAPPIVDEARRASIGVSRLEGSVAFSLDAMAVHMLSMPACAIGTPQRIAAMFGVSRRVRFGEYVVIAVFLSFNAGSGRRVQADPILSAGTRWRFVFQRSEVFGGLLRSHAGAESHAEGEPKEPLIFCQLHDLGDAIVFRSPASFEGSLGEPGNRDLVGVAGKRRGRSDVCRGRRSGEPEPGYEPAKAVTRSQRRSPAQRHALGERK
jgi:hypothetical protein